jgi:hypothetical protein
MHAVGKFRSKQRIPVSMGHHPCVVEHNTGALLAASAHASVDHALRTANDRRDESALRRRRALLADDNRRKRARTSTVYHGRAAGSERESKSGQRWRL